MTQTLNKVENRFSGPRRLHPFALFYLIGKNVKEFGFAFLPIIFGVVQKGNFLYLLFLLAGIALFLFFWSILSYLRYRYWITGEGLRIEQGVLFHKKRYIPLSRIQGVELEQNMLHRLIGLVKVRIDTAGTGLDNMKGEGTLSAVTKEEGELLKELLSPSLEVKEGPAYDEAASLWSWKLSFQRLLIAGATSGNIGVFIAFFFTIYNLFDQLLPWDQWYTEIFTFLAREYHSLAAIFFGLVLLFFISWIFSILGTILLYAGFTIRKEGEKIIIERGLFSRYTTTLSIRRIQSVHFVEGMLRLPFSYGTLRVDVSGYAMKGAGETVLAPLLTREEVEPFLRTFLPQFAGKWDGERKPLSSKGWIEAALFVWLPWSLLLILITFTLYQFLNRFRFLTSLSFLPLSIIPLFPLATYFYLKDGGWRSEGHFVIFRFRRRFARYTYIVPQQRIQTMTLSQSPIGRLLHTANLTAAIASYKVVTVPLRYMKEEEASLLFSMRSYPNH